MPETCNARVLAEGDSGRSRHPGECFACHANLDQETHKPTCLLFPPWRTGRLAIHPSDTLGRWADDAFEFATRRAWQAWAAAGYRFPGQRSAA